MSLWWTPFLPFELSLCCGETESFDRLRVLWKRCLPEPRRRLLKAEQFMWFIVGNQKKRTKPEAPIRMICWYSQKDLKNRFWGAAYIMNRPDSWRWGWRCWCFLIGMQLDGRKDEMPEIIPDLQPQHRCLSKTHLVHLWREHVANMHGMA